MEVHRAPLPAAVRGGRPDPVLLAAVALLLAGATIFLLDTESLLPVYEVVHVVSAAVWVGGAVALVIIGLLVERAGDPRTMTNLLWAMGKVGERVFTPASLVALASGIVLVERLGIGYGEFWIDFALVVWALSFVTGAGFIGPRARRLVAMIPERGLEDPATARSLRVVLRVALFDAVLLLLVVIDMTAPPSF